MIPIVITNKIKLIPDILNEVFNGFFPKITKSVNFHIPGVPFSPSFRRMVFAGCSSFLNNCRNSFHSIFFMPFFSFTTGRFLIYANVWLICVCASFARPDTVSDFQLPFKMISSPGQPGICFSQFITHLTTIGLTKSAYTWDFYSLFCISGELL